MLRMSFGNSCNTKYNTKTRNPHKYWLYTMFYTGSSPVASILFSGLFCPVFYCPVFICPGFHILSALLPAMRKLSQRCLSPSVSTVECSRSVRSSLASWRIFARGVLSLCDSLTNPSIPKHTKPAIFLGEYFSRSLFFT